MQQVYSEQHLTQAHHHGLVAGTLIGSLAVTVFIAVASVIASPQLILHPFNFTSQLSNKQQTVNSDQPGAGVTNLSQAVPATSGSAASAATRVNQ